MEKIEILQAIANKRQQIISLNDEINILETSLLQFCPFTVGDTVAVRDKHWRLTKIEPYAQMNGTGIHFTYHGQMQKSNGAFSEHERPITGAYLMQKVSI